MKKGLSVILGLCIMMSVFAGCSKEEEVTIPDVITEDTEWFNTTLTEIGKEYADGKSDYRSAHYLGEFKGKYAYSIEDSVDGSPFAKVVLYDENGNVTDVAEATGGHFYYAMIVGDEIRVKNYNGDMVANFDTGKIDYVNHNDYSSDWRAYLGSDIIDGYRFDRYFLSSNVTNTSIVEVYQGDDLINTFDLNEAFPNEDFTQISPVLKTDDGRFILIRNDPYDPAYYELDIDGGRVTDVTSDYSWLNPLRNAKFKYTSTGLYAIDTSSIYKIDTSSRSYSKYLTTMNCDIPIFDTYLGIYDVTDDRIVLCTSRDFSNFDNAVKKIYTLDRADSNPHAGKTVLRAASLHEDFFCGFAECLTHFNSSQNDYFMTIDDRYFRSNFYPDTADGDIEAIIGSFNDADAAVGNKLAVDLKAGDGPDILFNGGDHLEFNNDSCLTELNGYIDGPDGLNRDEYFDNLLRMCETDGKMYQIPLCFSLDMILTTSSEVRDDQTGFTFDEYKQFVSGAMNGRDVVMTGVWEDENYKSSFMNTILSEVLGILIDNGQADFDNEEFRALAEYAANDLRRSNDQECSRIANNLYTSSFNYYLHYISYAGWDPSDVKALGLPGVTPHGPSAAIDTTAATTSNCKSADGCFSFIKFLLSSEGQELMMKGAIAENVDGLNLIRKDTFDEYCQVQADNYNDVCDQFASQYSDSSVSEMRRMGFPCIKADQSDINRYRAICEDLSHRIVYDPQITSIVNEEIAPYFEGDKSLDDCIAVINSRVQIVLNERK